MAEMLTIGKDTPGPDEYKIPDQGLFKKRAMSIKFDLLKSPRLEPIKRTENTDFYETDKAAAYANKRAVAAGFSKSPKKSFAEMAAAKNKTPGVGNYKISDRSYKMLSPSPGGRKR